MLVCVRWLLPIALASIVVPGIALGVLRRRVSFRVGLGLLMDERETNVVFKLGDCEIKLVLVLAVLVRVQLVE